MSFELPIHWNDYEDIAMKLYERFGDDFNESKIYRIRFTDLLKWVLEIPNFTGKAEESIEALNSALGYNPDFDKARYNLGRAYIKQSNPEMAQVQYEILKNSRSDWADRLFVLLNP